MAHDPPELVREHIRYEVIMLDQTRRALRETSDLAPVVLNSLMEAFCIHARNLNEFFLENGRDDTLQASDFADSYIRPENTPRRRELFRKVNKQISHLTLDRTSVPEEKIGTPEREEMYSLLYADLQRFTDCLRPELRSSWRIAFASASE